jgi:hypothetical protein
MLHLARATRNTVFGATAAVAAAMQVLLSDALPSTVPPDPSEFRTTPSARVAWEQTVRQPDAMQASADYSRDGKAVAILISLRKV